MTCLPRLSFLFVCALLNGALPSWADDNAVDGMDVVSLRDSGHTVDGNDDISTQWKGREWVFANEANRAIFESNPRAYAPGFGGSCPVGLAEGTRKPGRPEFAVVVGGTLYLTASAAARGRMLADPEQILGRAAAMWAQLGH